MKVKRVHVHVRDGRLYWGKKPGDISGSFVELASVRAVEFGRTEAQQKHVRQNATVAPARQVSKGTTLKQCDHIFSGLTKKAVQRSVHAAWHCVTVRPNRLLASSSFARRHFASVFFLAGAHGRREVGVARWPDG